MNASHRREDDQYCQSAHEQDGTEAPDRDAPLEADTGEELFADERNRRRDAPDGREHGQRIDESTPHRIEAVDPEKRRENRRDPQWRASFEHEVRNRDADDGVGAPGRNAPVEQRVRQCTADRRARFRLATEVRRGSLVVKERLSGSPEDYSGGDTGSENQREVRRVGVTRFCFGPPEFDLSPRAEQQKETVTDRQKDNAEKDRPAGLQDSTRGSVDSTTDSRRKQCLNQKKQTENGHGECQCERILFGHELLGDVDRSSLANPEQERFAGLFVLIRRVRKYSQIPQSGGEKDERNDEPRLA